MVATRVVVKAEAKRPERAGAGSDKGRTFGAEMVSWPRAFGQGARR